LGRPYEGVGKDYLISGWFATSDWVAKNQDSVKKFADVMRQTAQWANANSARARTILAKYAKLNDDPAVKRAPVVLARTLEPASLAPIINLGVKYKVLTSAIPSGDLIASLAGKP
jgi:ABC-type nitrate/sulfonate/bicarbonate transport system substrate-binding protein